MSEHNFPNVNELDDDDITNASTPLEDRGEVLAEKQEKKKSNKVAIALLVFVVGILIIFGFAFFAVSVLLKSDEVVSEPDPTLMGREVATPDLGTYQEQLREAERRREERLQAERERAERERAEQAQREAEAQELANRIAPPPDNNRTPRPPQAEAEPDPNAPEFRQLTGNVLLAGVGGGGAGDDEAAFFGGNEGVSHSNSNSGINNMLQGGTYPPGSAWKMRGLNLMLRRGTTIPCVLQNRVVSTYPSLSSCVITQDVYSADGSKVLIERGSVAYGEQSLTLRQGQARLFMTWNEIDTTAGIRVRIDSLATDNLGASGVDAYVDKHFWDRFGGAIMLSLIDDGLAILAQRIQDEEMQFNSTRGTGRNMAEIALEDSINIPPTGYVNQGTLLNIRVARDVDFSSVYETKGIHQK